MVLVVGGDSLNLALWVIGLYAVVFLLPAVVTSISSCSPSCSAFWASPLPRSPPRFVPLRSLFGAEEDEAG